MEPALQARVRVVPPRGLDLLADDHPQRTDVLRRDDPPRTDEGFLEAELARSIEARTARIGVFGLGSVGLPLARAFVEAGFRVHGFDTDRERLAQLARGERPLHHLPHDLVSALRASARFTASDTEHGPGALDVAIVCVPTPLTPARTPDLQHVVAAAHTLARRLRRGALVVLESTSPPGTTRDLLGGILHEHGFAAGLDVWLAHSPERDDPARAGTPLSAIRKLVGGTCERSGRLASELYRSAFLDVERVRNAEVAEAAKLFENTFRAVNIALANELKLVLDALSIDVWDVLEAAATKPFGFMKFTPGPGTGGQCIPVAPEYLAWSAREAGAQAPLIELASAVNRAMPQHVVVRTQAALRARGKELAGARVLIVGLAYKGDVDVVAQSPALELFERFEAQGAAVEYSDPLVLIAPPCAGRLRGRRSLALDARVIESFDVLVLATAHADLDHELIARHARLVIDTRNALASRMQGFAHYVTA